MSARRAFLAAAVCGLILGTAGGCGGGGGGDAPADGPIPLTTNLLGTSTRSITYNVTGQYTDDTGTRAVTGTSGTYRIADQYLHSVLCTSNTETTTSLQVGVQTSVTTTRVYGYRDGVSSRAIQVGARMSSGEDVYFTPTVPVGPLAYSVGVGEDIVSGVAGYDPASFVQRWGASELRWHVLGTANVQTPLGYFECYVVAVRSVEYDYDAFVSRTSEGTAYVRPEIGTLLIEESVTLDDGFTTATANTTRTATAFSN